MADTQIDELRLDITVEDNTSGESSDKKVKNLATAISRLNKTLQAFDNAKFSKTFENMAKGIDPFVAKIEKVSGALESLATIVKKSGLDKAVKEATGQLSPTGKETVSTGDGESKPIQAIGEQAKPLDNIKKQLDGINKELDKTAKKSEKAKKPLGKLLKSFGRIAMYRAVRRTIQEITQAFMESVDGIAKYNSEFRDTMGSLQTSIDKLKVSAGVGFYQVLILLAPTIEQISNGIVAVSNSLSKVSAQLRGAAQYTKINTDYMKKYKSALDGTLLSFDTFTTLGKGGGIDFSQILDTVDTPLDKEKWSDLDIAISGVVSAFKGVWKILKTVIDGIAQLTEWLTNKNLLTPAVYAFLGILLAIKAPFALLITGIATLIGGWQKMSTTAKILIPVIAALASVLTGLAVAKAAAAAGIAAPAMAGITAAAIAAGVALTAGSIIALKAYKDGGMMTRNTFSGAGTMYALAGESGAEVVAQGSAGTGVLNVDQFADAMVSALVRYGAARDTSNGTTIVLDGNKVGQLVASNVGFRNEANRRNAGLNWK